MKTEAVDLYISQFPTATQAQLEALRNIIIGALPKTAEEVISYKMPAYKYKQVLVYFAGYKNHIGFYPTGKPIQVFAEELTKYKTSKGAIQFAIDKKLPATLIKKIVKYRLNAVLQND
jgi:uncharacterized protein YdhG (YjbR/CyaY superfamily)